jgi:hypothetical protein
LVNKHFFEAGVGGDHRDLATVGHQPFEDGALDAEIHCHDAIGPLRLALDSLVELRLTEPGPAVGLPSAHRGRQIQAIH